MHERETDRIRVADLNDAELRQKLNLETGQVEWDELQRHFARGSVLRVAPGLDLVETAFRLSRDDKDWIEPHTRSCALAPASSDDARSWHACGQRFWAVVVAPWILVQPCEPGAARPGRQD